MAFHTKEEFKSDLISLGVKPGDTIFMHSSFKSIGEIEDGACGLFSALLELLGDEGTLLLPAFSYDFVGYENPVFDREKTKSCVGFLPEYFRTSVEGVVRSMHATHSISAKGARALELISGHETDFTPVGENSPIIKLAKSGGKILLLGCSADHLAIMHGVEEMAEPPYLFDRKNPITYILTDSEREIRVPSIRHDFTKQNGDIYYQRYSRVLPLLTESEASYGKVLEADCALLSAEAVLDRGFDKLLDDPFYFVD